MITYPIDCISPRQRHQFCIRMQEVLRLVHNGFGKWFREGLSKTEHDNLMDATAHIIKTSETPQIDEISIITALKAKYPYTAKLSESDWIKFKMEDFKARGAILGGAIVEHKNAMKSDTQWSKGINI